MAIAPAIEVPIAAYNGAKIQVKSENQKRRGLRVLRGLLEHGFCDGKEQDGRDYHDDDKVHRSPFHPAAHSITAHSITNTFLKGVFLP